MPPSKTLRHVTILYRLSLSLSLPLHHRCLGHQGHLGHLGRRLPTSRLLEGSPWSPSRKMLSEDWMLLMAGTRLIG
ncbi:hypothetical protein BKA57DRAFT_452927 [Linnemannia elongata]|nr:hypothetical protein BKA57DRAFT_452927 [Linnemannia elongata]